MASNTAAHPPPPPPTNGLMSAPSTAPSAGGNRKKQKRRAKQAAKAAQPAPSASPPVAGHHHSELDYDDDPLASGEDDYEYSDAEADHHYHDHHYHSQHAASNGVHPSAPRPAKKRNKKKTNAWHDHGAYNPDMLPPPPNAPPPPSSALRSMHKNPPHHVGNIWNTSTQQERQNIKDFWLSLSEDERKSLLKIEKEAVLRKMKQQQKHSCSCTVCGRKRTAIEEELEVLYEGYYEELEQYAHHDHPPLPSTDGLIPGPLQQARQPALPPPPNPLHKTSHLHEHLDDEEYSDEEEYSDDEEEYSDEEPEPVPRPGVPDFFNFGQNLTVKGILTPWLEKLQIGLKGKADNLLTVADDLLKNDGRKFIEMMEQLAERRMQRETEAAYAAANPTHPGAYPSSDGAYNGEDPLAAGDEFDDDEASYDSQEEYDDDLEEEDEMGGLTEEQRMQEGRRMFQIFAARMFEQRVLTAYREKVAAERQQKLLEELEDETNREAQKEAKKQRDAQKKKDKKKQQQQAKAEEKARKDAEKAAEEARLKEAEEKKQEDSRRKKEEQRKKREEERKKQEEERARKEAEKQRRAQEEQSRREDAERKAREQKAAEKAKKEEARKRERDEREAREKEARERKAQEDKERKDRETKSKTQLSHQNPPQIAKRPTQAGPVAIPGAPSKHATSANPSPHPVVATPAIPKAPTPAKQKQPSHQGSHASSPKQTASQISSAPSKASSPSNSSGQQQQATAPKTIMQKPGGQMPGPQHPMQTASPLHQQHVQPPPGMSHPQHPGGFAGMTPMGFAGFPGPQGPMMQGNMGHRGPMPMYPHQGPPMGVPNRMPFGMNGMPTPPPGMMPQQGRGMMFPFDGHNAGQPPPGFGQQHIPHQASPPIGPPHAQGPPGGDAARGSISTHSRQHSSDKERFEAGSNQPIQRPAPIQRPSSVKPGQGRNGSNAEVDDLSKHLGSSALLADDDEPLPVNPADNRRHSGMVPGARSVSNAGLGQLGGGFGAPPGGFGTPGPNWAAPSPFGHQPGLGQQNWGSLPSPGMSGWVQNNNAFAANGAFASIGAAPMHRPTGTSLNRPLTIRLAVCQACKQLSNENGGQGDGYHDVNELLHRIEANRPLLDSPPTLRELEEICETEGDSQNGGGELYIRRSNSSGGNAFAVKWEPDAHSADPSARGHIGGLGEIGSPVPAKTTPAIGFGAPGMGRASSGGFQGMSAVGSAPNF